MSDTDLFSLSDEYVFNEQHGQRGSSSLFGIFEEDEYLESFVENKLEENWSSTGTLTKESSGTEKEGVREVQGMKSWGREEELECLSLTNHHDEVEKGICRSPQSPPTGTRSGESSSPRDDQIGSLKIKREEEGGGIGIGIGYPEHYIFGRVPEGLPVVPPPRMGTYGPSIFFPPQAQGSLFSSNSVHKQEAEKRKNRRERMQHFRNKRKGKGREIEHMVDQHMVDQHMVDQHMVDQHVEQIEEEDKDKRKQIQKLRNRVSAQKSRDRQKEGQQKLEREIEHMGHENLQLKNSIAIKDQQIANFNKVIEQLCPSSRREFNRLKREQNPFVGEKLEGMGNRIMGGVMGPGYVTYFLGAISVVCVLLAYISLSPLLFSLGGGGSIHSNVLPHVATTLQNANTMKLSTAAIATPNSDGPASTYFPRNPTHHLSDTATDTPTLTHGSRILGEKSTELAVLTSDDITERDMEIYLQPIKNDEIPYNNYIQASHNLNAQNIRSLKNAFILKTWEGERIAEKKQKPGLRGGAPERGGNIFDCVSRNYEDLGNSQIAAQGHLGISNLQRVASHYVDTALLGEAAVLTDSSKSLFEREKLQGDMCHYLQLLIPEKEIRRIKTTGESETLGDPDSEYMLEIGCKAFSINRIPLSQFSKANHSY